MDGSPPYNPPSQFAFNPRRSRIENQPANDRQLSESYHPRQNIHSSVTEPIQSHHTRQNLDLMPSEQSGLLNRLPITHRPTSSPNAPLHQLETLPKLRTTSALHFEYHTRYPSPPPTEAGFQTQSANIPSFTYPSSASAQRSMRDQAPNDRRTAPSPPLHLSPTLHRANGSSSSSAGNSPMITLPPLSSVPHRPPMHRGVDQAPNPQHVDIQSSPPMQRRPSIAQLPRDNPEQGLLRRHTLDSSHVPDQQMVASSGRKRTLSTLPPPSYPAQPHIQLGTQQVPLQPVQINLAPRPYSSPPPIPTPHHDNPPTVTLAISPTPPSPSPSQPPQPPQSPPPPQSLPQPAAADGPSSVNDASLSEAADTALEPLRLGFENTWTQTVQNVRHVMNSMQKDLNRLLATERRKNVNLLRCLVNSSEKFKGQEWAVETLRKENGSLMKEIEKLRRDGTQKITVIDALNHENNVLRRENEESKKKNDEMKGALTRAAGFISQYKEELAKVKADAETFRKYKEAGLLSELEAKPAASPDLLHHRETARLHAEKERERIFNDAVKQLRALTALEVSSSSNPDITHERDSKEVVVDRDHDRRVRSSSVSTSKQDPSSSSPLVIPEVHSDINQRHPGSSTTPPPPPTKVVSTNNSGGDKSDEHDSREMVGVEMDLINNNGDDSIVAPLTIIQLTSAPSPNPAVPELLDDVAENLEKDVQILEQQPTADESSRNFNEELNEPQRHDLEAQRQRQRQARRGPTPISPSISSPPQTRSGKTSPLALRAGMKRNREEYEDGQVAGDHHHIRLTETEAVRTDVAGNLEDGEEREREEKEVEIDISTKDKTRHKGKNEKVVMDGRQATPQQSEIQTVPPPSPNTPVKDAHPKALGRWSYYTHYRDHAGLPLVATKSLTTQQSTSLPPSPQAQRPPKRHPKLGINHMDLLYKTEKEVMICRICLSLEQNPDATAAERRKAKANTKKFPLNASWTDLINHCQTEHAKACEDMEKLSPSQLAELKQRMPPVSSTR